MNKFNTPKTLITGGSGMVGSALKKYLPNATFVSSVDYNLTDQLFCSEMFHKYKPDYVIHLAALVGGVKLNMTHMADCFTQNLYINTNVLECAKRSKVKKVISMLSTCIYPDKIECPYKEEDLHSGEAHFTNFAYAHAKRSLDIGSRAYRQQYGCNFITCIPNNIFGENDNFHYENSHVIPAMIRKIYEAKLENKDVTLWGDGSAIREFTYSDDIARLILFLMENYNEPTPINIGNNTELSIKEVATIIGEILQFEGNIIWDTSNPNGKFKKTSDNTKLLNLGWKKENYSDFYNSLSDVCEWFCSVYPNVRGYK